MNSVEKLFDILCEHDEKLGRSFSLIPSENILSPLARLAFLSDGFSRYFFNEKEVFGRWSFQGGSIIGRIQTEILVPLLQKFGGARHVNVHPISGLTGMTLALAAFGGPSGSRVLSIAPRYGGHPDARYVAEKLGYVPHEVPFRDWTTVDLDALAQLVRRVTPSLVYIDHATSLYPLDLETVIAAIRSASASPVHIHVDSSHVNGLIWGRQFPIPLQFGANSYGGSTHKTFPGPHKAVIFTNDDALAERLILTAVNMISHHHTASMVALAIALLEFEVYGEAYAAQVCKNAQAFAVALAKRGLAVQGGESPFTRTHQVWLDAPPGTTANDAADRLFEAGIIVNPFNPLPSLGGLGIRMGVNEATRLGMQESDMETLASLFVEALGTGGRGCARQLAEFRATFGPAYCFQGDSADELVARFLHACRATRLPLQSRRGMLPALSEPECRRLPAKVRKQIKRRGTK